MIPPITNENYNETVLIPLLQEKLNDLVTQGIVLEAKLRIAQKEKADLEKRLAATAAPVPAVPPVGIPATEEVDQTAAE